MPRYRIPCKTDKHRNLLLTEEFNSDKQVREALKKEIKSRWPDFWDKVKNDFKYKEIPHHGRT